VISTLKTRKILVVEDSPEDFEATVRALRKAGVENPIRHCQDGDEALDYLEVAASSLGDSPCIVLLDLNLPGTNGREVLAELKERDALRTLPVVILTTSTDPNDIEACYDIGASSYIRKPVGMREFEEAMKRFADYWFATVELPPQNGGRL